MKLSRNIGVVCVDDKMCSVWLEKYVPKKEVYFTKLSIYFAAHALNFKFSRFLWPSANIVSYNELCISVATQQYCGNICINPFE